MAIMDKTASRTVARRNIRRLGRLVFFRFFGFFVMFFEEPFSRRSIHACAFSVSCIGESLFCAFYPLLQGGARVRDSFTVFSNACDCEPVMIAIGVRLCGYWPQDGGHWTQDIFTMMNSVFEKYPRTVDAAVDKLLEGMSFQDKSKVANMGPEKLVSLHKAFGDQIQAEFRLPGNDPLMASCAEYAGLPKLSGEQASYVILKVLWAKLQTSDVLRVVK
jgi:hypothetical protein